MLQIAWQKEANQIIEISQSGTEFHNESNSGNRKSVEYVRPGRFLLSFGWQAMTKPSINLASCSIWHEASLQKLHPFIVMSTITIVGLLNCNKKIIVLWCMLYRPKTHLIWMFPKDHEVFVIGWKPNNQRFSNFSLQKCISFINLKWFVSNKKNGLHIMHLDNGEYGYIAKPVSFSTKGIAFSLLWLVWFEIVDFL